MIRASKADLRLLPSCTRRVTLLDFSPDHAACYNELVEVVRRNLVTAGGWGRARGGAGARGVLC